MSFDPDTVTDKHMGELKRKHPGIAAYCAYDRDPQH